MAARSSTYCANGYSPHEGGLLHQKRRRPDPPLLVFAQREGASQGFGSFGTGGIREIAVEGRQRVSDRIVGQKMQLRRIRYAIRPSKLDKQVERRRKLATGFCKRVCLNWRWLQLDANSSLHKCIITNRKHIRHLRAVTAPPSLNVLGQGPQAGTPGAARLLPMGYSPGATGSLLFGVNHFLKPMDGDAQRSDSNVAFAPLQAGYSCSPLCLRD
jgi:hypothetical protein